MRQLLVLLLVLSPSVALAQNKAAELATVVYTYEVTQFLNPARPENQPDPSLTLKLDDPIGMPHPTHAQLQESLAQLIMDTVQPDTWVEAGGTAGAIKFNGETMQIEQTPEAHRLIHSLLAQLGERPDPKEKRKKPVDDLPPDEKPGQKPQELTYVYDVRDVSVRTTGVKVGEKGNVTRNEAVDALLKQLMDKVAPESWIKRGGSLGSIIEVHGQLIVTQTPKNHRALRAILKELKKSVT